MLSDLVIYTVGAITLYFYKRVKTKLAKGVILILFVGFVIGWTYLRIKYK